MRAKAWEPKILLQKSFIPGKNLLGLPNLAGLARNFSGQLYTANGQIFGFRVDLTELRYFVWGNRYDNERNTSSFQHFENPKF